METIGSKVTRMLNNEYFGAYQTNVYMNHLIVQVVSSCSFNELRKIKTEINRLVSIHFPSRQENLPFVITRKGFPDESFILFKNFNLKHEPQLT